MPIILPAVRCTLTNDSLVKSIIFHLSAFVHEILSPLRNRIGIFLSHLRIRNENAFILFVIPQIAKMNQQRNHIIFRPKRLCQSRRIWHTRHRQHVRENTGGTGRTVSVLEAWWLRNGNIVGAEYRRTVSRNGTVPVREWSVLCFGIIIRKREEPSVAKKLLRVLPCL